MLTHAVAATDFDGQWEERVLCGRVKIDSMVDRPVSGMPTCFDCCRRVRRFIGLKAFVALFTSLFVLGCARPAHAAWEWHPVDWSVCRDGSTSGVGVSLGASGASSPTLLWLQEGGACWDVVSCASNRASFSADDWVRLAPTLGGVFDRSDPLNPFAAWSFVFVAYCSGDWHAGAASDVDVAGVGVQQYRGFETTRRAARIETSDYPASRFALVSSWGDRVISSIYGRGQDACTASYPLPLATFGQGLASVAASDPWTFLYPGDCHTALVSSARLDGVPGLAPWLASFVGSP
jgi:hypothetical protein